ncbi:GFA family protein [Acinetobacter soli]|uniref:GFA family protein n=1 Tax=Acinetobacter soli TaxID=487316 RepID=UPI002430FD0D|nr:GFA family protein [Acinetobacter soli]
MTHRNWAARYFCHQCGTNLFYKLNEREYYSINAELFDLTSDAKIHLEIYADHKPDYYQFLTKSPQLTERQVIDQFSSDE